MSVFGKTLTYKTQGNTDIIDITPDVIQIVEEAGIQDGILLVYSPGSTVSITTIEYEPGLIEDIKEALDQIAPQNKEYQHNKRWHDGNGHSHIRASILGQDATFPISDTRVQLGTWQQIILIDLDVKPRSRNVIIKIVGD